MLKIKVLNVFSDLFLMNSPIINKHFMDIMLLLNEACEASITATNIVNIAFSERFYSQNIYYYYT